jgi:GT2 family glycosyltransferase
MNGKIGEAMSAGLPVVTTSLGALGMGLEHEKNCLVADDAAGFAAQIRRLHGEESLWERLRANGLAHVGKLYSDTGIEAALLQAVRSLLPLPRPGSTGKRAAPALRLAPPSFPPAPGRPKFSVIVLAHNQWPFTELCLRSLAHAERLEPGLAEYLLVDNGSLDGTADFAARIPNLRVLPQAGNLGFAGGNNAGIAASRGENLVLLNNDTVVSPRWLSRFAHYVDKIPGLGVLGPSTNTESGQALPNVDYASLDTLFAFSERIQRERGGAWERVKKISGLCMVLPRAALDRIGMLDTEFGLGYFEDDDLCLRAEDLGLTVAWAKDVYVHHFGSVSFGSQSKARAQFLEEGMARFAFKWGKRGLDHITKQHGETLLRSRRPKTLSY